MKESWVAHAGREMRKREKKGNMRRENGMVSRLSPGRNRSSSPFPVVSGDEAGIVERDVPRRGRRGGRGLLGCAWERRLLDWCTRKTERKEYREKERERGHIPRVGPHSCGWKVSSPVGPLCPVSTQVKYPGHEFKLTSPS